MTSPAPLSVGDALPQNVAALAATEGLGELRATIKPLKANGVRLASGVFMIIVGLFLFVVPGLYFAWAVARFPNFNRKQAARRLYLFENGLVNLGAGGSADVFRWDSMTVLQEIVRSTMAGATVATNYKYTLFKADGSNIKLTNFFENPAAWGAAVQREITRAQLPGATAALERGETVPFADFAVTARGLSIGGRGETPWSEVQKVAVRAGFVHVSRAGKMIRVNKPVKKIPNFFLFLALCERFVAIR